MNWLIIIVAYFENIYYIYKPRCKKYKNNTTYLIYITPTTYKLKNKHNSLVKK